MLSSLVNSLATLSNSTNASVYLALINTTQIDSIYPLFIEANSTILYGFSQLSTFAEVISKVASMSASSCCSYTRSGRVTFASYAIPYLFNYTNLDLAALYSLGPCVVSVLPVAYLSNMTYSVFASYFPTLGNAFQPDATQTPYVQSFVTQMAANASSQDTLVFSTLSDLALYYNFSSTYASTISSSGWVSYGNTLMSTILSARDPTSSTVQNCQLGLANTAQTSALISTYGSTYVSNYVTNVTASGRRKKRSTSGLTCTQLSSMTSTLNQLTTTQLAAISLADFISCQTLLGYSSNSWSLTQAQTLAGTAKTYYGSAANISDTNIAALNSIMVGFASTDLSNLVFSTTTSIGALGALSGWTTAQLSALATPLTTYITSYLSSTITSSFMTSTNNLLCCLTSAQINNLTSTAFSTGVSAVAKISLSCPNIASWYTFSRTQSSYSSLSTATLTELGSTISGITISDLATLSADSISSITTNAFQYMPAETVNSLSTTQLAGLSATQLTALLNSPNYSSFSSSITASLSSLASGGSATVTTTTTTTTTSASYVLSGSYSFLMVSTLITLSLVRF